MKRLNPKAGKAAQQHEGLRKQTPEAERKAAEAKSRELRIRKAMHQF